MIETTTEGRTARIRLRSGKEGNPVSRAMLADLAKALQGAAALDVIVIDGDGTDFTIGRDRSEPKAADAFANFSLVTAVNEGLAAFEGVVVAAVRGRAHGFGVGLTLRTDLAVAAESTHFWMDEVQLGIPPMFVMERMLDHLPPKQALDIVLTSRAFTARDAQAMGLVSRVVPDEDLDTEIDALVAQLVHADPRVLRSAKRYLQTVPKASPEFSSAFALIQQTRFG